MELPPDLAAIAARELGETPAVRAAALKELQARVMELGEGSLHRTDEGYLLMYLRWAKFDVKKALKRLQAMEKWLKANADLVGDYTQYTMESFRELYGIGFMSLLDQPANNGARVVTMQPKKLVPGSLTDPTLMIKWSIFALHRAVDDPALQVTGQLIIETFEGMSFLDAVRFGSGIIPRRIMKANMDCMNNCMPFRLNGIWLFHQSRVISVLMAIVHPFLSKKMKERIRAFGSDYSVLHQRIDPAYLPPDFGGTASDEYRWVWFNKMAASEKKAQVI